MAHFEAHDRVRLCGLSKAELNDLVCLVLPAADDEEQRRLDETGRIKVSYFPKTLSLKPDNLVAAGEPDFAVLPFPFTVLQIAQGSEQVAEFCAQAEEAGEDFSHLGLVADLDLSRDFAEALWNIYDRVREAPAHLPRDFERMITDNPGHHLYRISLEQLGHEVVVEACDGVWRGFQAMKKKQASEPQDFQEYAGVLIQTADDHEAKGYSAREWLSAEPVGSADGGAYKLWGGGKDLSRKCVEEVLALVSKLQCHAQKIVEKLREQVPKGITEDEMAEWAEEMMEKARLTLTPSRPGTPRNGVSNEVWVFVSDVTPEHDFSLPPDLAKAFMEDYAKLTGEFPDPWVFLQMLHSMSWETTETDDGEGMGWTLQQVNLRS